MKSDFSYAWQKVSLKDIAEKLGVSKTTVSLALRNSPSISKATKRLVVKTAKESGYVHNGLFSRLMSRMKDKNRKGLSQTIALINANEDKNAHKNHPTIPQYLKGIRRACRREGFVLNEFWLNDPKLTEKSLFDILKARGIKGGIIVGLMSDNDLGDKFNSIWRNFKFVVTGVKTLNPVLPFTCSDQFLLAYHATKIAISRGYRRPALVLDSAIDKLIEGRFTGGFLRAQLALDKKDRIDPFFNVRQAKSNRQIFYDFYKKAKPDCILSLYNGTRDWLEDMGIRAPENIGLIQLEWREQESDWSGMNQRNDLVGEAAVEKLSQMLASANPAEEYIKTATMISPEWVESKTLRPLD